MGNPPGYIPDGSGSDGAAFGRDPATGRAYKRDGTVRKARTVKSPEQVLADLAAQEQKAQARMGQRILEGRPEMAAFMAAFGQHKTWLREAKALGTPEGVAKRRAALEAALATLDQKAEAAQAWLNQQAGTEAAEVFSNVGAAYIRFTKENKRPPNEEEAANLIGQVVDTDTVATVEAAANPENDPFRAFRRNRSDDEDDAL